MVRYTGREKGRRGHGPSSASPTCVSTWRRHYIAHDGAAGWYCDILYFIPFHPFLIPKQLQQRLETIPLCSRNYSSQNLGQVYQSVMCLLPVIMFFVRGRCFETRSIVKLNILPPPIFRAPKTSVKRIFYITSEDNPGSLQGPAEKRLEVHSAYKTYELPLLIYNLGRILRRTLLPRGSLSYPSL